MVCKENDHDFFQGSIKSSEPFSAAFDPVLICRKCGLTVRLREERETAYAIIKEIVDDYRKRKKR